MRLIDALQATGMAQRQHRIRKNRKEFLLVVANGMDYFTISGPNFPPRPLLASERSVYTDGYSDWETYGLAID